MRERRKREEKHDEEVEGEVLCFWRWLEIGGGGERRKHMEEEEL